MAKVHTRGLLGQALHNSLSDAPQSLMRCMILHSCRQYNAQPHDLAVKNSVACKHAMHHVKVVIIPLAMHQEEDTACHHYALAAADGQGQ